MATVEEVLAWRGNFCRGPDPRGPHPPIGEWEYDFDLQLWLPAQPLPEKKKWWRW